MEKEGTGTVKGTETVEGRRKIKGNTLLETKVMKDCMKTEQEEKSNKSFQQWAVMLLTGQKLEADILQA